MGWKLAGKEETCFWEYISIHYLKYPLKQLRKPCDWRATADRLLQRVIRKIWPSAASGRGWEEWDECLCLCEDCKLTATDIHMGCQENRPGETNSRLMTQSSADHVLQLQQQQTDRQENLNVPTQGHALWCNSSNTGSNLHSFTCLSSETESFCLLEENHDNNIYFTTTLISKEAHAALWSVTWMTKSQHK